MFEEMRVAGASRVLALCDAASGLEALIAFDDVTLGPACGGIRTLRYDGLGAALADVARLAGAMTLKCALAGLDAGGGKTVVLDHPGLDRVAAFRLLGRFIEDLGGMYRAAGDLGTTLSDLEAAAQYTRFVDVSGADLGSATGRGIVNCMRAVATVRNASGLSGLTVAIQGCGLIGAGVARALAAQGANVILADVHAGLAKALAAELGGVAVPIAEILSVQADVVSPCAVGGVLTGDAVSTMKAWAVCGGANNQIASPEVPAMLARRQIAYVPDFLASAGAVIQGIAPTVMGRAPESLIEALFDTAMLILEEADAEGRTTLEVAERRARTRIAAKRATRTTACE